MAKNKEGFNPRKYMEMAIEIMNLSIQEPRQDKVSPKVGAVLITPDGKEETAFRGELRHGDHAEFTLLERKNRSNSLDGSLLFATLEPCAPGARKHPKLGCAERIVNARIKKVWIGIEDPDPSVDRKGIKYLIDNGVEVELFDADLQKQIREANKQFIQEAEERAKKAKEETEASVLSTKEKIEIRADLEDLSIVHLESFIKSAKLNVELNTSKFHKILTYLGVLVLTDKGYVPTGMGLLLFGERPQLMYQNSLIRATFKTKGRGENIETIDGPLILQPDKIQSWYEPLIGKQIDRTNSERKVIYDYPLVVLREAIINAIVHRDYDIEGAPIYFEINDDAIIIKSPGKPIEPLTIEQIKRFNAPSLSRNPKIMYVFDQMKLVEHRGLGFSTIRDLPQNNNLPLPIVTYDAPYIVFTFPRSEEGLKNVSPNKILSELNQEELIGYEFVKLIFTLKRRDYEEKFGFDTKKAERHLNKMLDLGLIVRKGSGPSTHYELNSL